MQLNVILNLQIWISIFLSSEFFVVKKKLCMLLRLDKILSFIGIERHL